MARIARNISRIAFSLERAKVNDHCADLPLAKGMKGRHAGSGYPVGNDVGQLSIGETPDLLVFGNIDRFVASTAIKSMTSRAGGVVYGLARSARILSIRWSRNLSERRGDVEGRQKKTKPERDEQSF